MLFLSVSILISQVGIEENTVLRSTSYAETCTVDDIHLGEKTKPLPQIYGKKCSSAVTNFEIAGQFQTYKKVKAAMYRSQAKRFLLPPATHQQLLFNKVEAAVFYV
ncbi:hypothetical protein T4E_2782 [Trichinella pseudospiralis]|uniref:Uncharacterized protein n=1 Tax=Trichinella pseudospiralis TaxID=6337 RepID=A0A0V0YK21_TRIPS|nr:hypothetical protein T4E_2782 [Trichinella pseudospiralis]